MLRAFGVCVLALGLAGSPALAKDSKKVSCEKQADILDQLVEMRLKGVGEKKALRRLTEGDEAVEETYRIAVLQYGGWIYSQRRKDAKNHDHDAFVQVCLDQ